VVPGVMLIDRMVRELEKWLQSRSAQACTVVEVIDSDWPTTTPGNAGARRQYVWSTRLFQVASCPRVAPDAVGQRSHSKSLACLAQGEQSQRE